MLPQQVHTQHILTSSLFQMYKDDKFTFLDKHYKQHFQTLIYWGLFPLLAAFHTIVQERECSCITSESEAVSRCP